MGKYRVAIITVSDKGAAGQRLDESGPAIREMLLKDGQYEIVEETILPDSQLKLEKAFIRICNGNIADLVLTTGGTGFAKRDVTPEATLSVADKIVPGISEYMRMKSMEITPKGMLSRGVSVIRHNTLIINLPGSPKAVRENMGFILPHLGHGMDIMLGHDGECGRK